MVLLKTIFIFMYCLEKRKSRVLIYEKKLVYLNLKQKFKNVDIQGVKP